MSPLAPRGTPLISGRRPGAAIVAILAMVLTIGLQVFVAAPAPADIVQGTNGTMDITYNQVINGDFISVGNGLLQCSGTNANNGGTCAQMYSQAPATGTTSNNYVNDLYQMIAYNGGTGRGVTTVNSSSATFAVPQGATIVKAMLYWSANTGQNSTGTGWTGTGSATCGSSAGGATYPASGALNWQTQAPVFSVNGGGVCHSPGDCGQFGARADLGHDQVLQRAVRHHQPHAGDGRHRHRHGHDDECRQCVVAHRLRLLRGLDHEPGLRLRTGHLRQPVLRRPPSRPL